MPRTLRSKFLRAELWLRAGGKCAICGDDLADNWHADHIEPWIVTGRTNLYEMQALCATCNLAKGSKPSVKWRQHQRELIEVARQIQDGRFNGRTIVVDAAPGSGKSSIPVILAAHLIPHTFDKTMWVVPRVALQKQGARNFQDFDLRGALGHRHEIRTSTNQENPSRGLSGFITTYQALREANLGIYTHDFDRYRYILILDEVHHVWAGGRSHARLAPLVERAALVVLMTGTASRHDRKPIAFMPYLETEGGLSLNTTTNQHVWFIQYSRTDALLERAIVPVYFDQVDGKTRWLDAEGQDREAASFEDAGDDTRAALNTFLATDAAPELLEKCTADWQTYRRQKPAAKLLVVADQIANAKKHLKTLRRLGISRSEIATTDDTAAAAAAIDHFKLPNTDGAALDALVTVAMAYEGLDVPAITHIACLTNIRSVPWIEQMLARGTRYCADLGPWEHQRCRVWAPADKLLDETIARIKAEQDPVVRELEEQEAAREAERAETERDDRATIAPIFSQTTRWKSEDLDGSGLDYDETEYYQSILRTAGLDGYISVLDADRLLKAAQQPRRSTAAVLDRPEPTPDEREKALRLAINKHCSRYDMQEGWEHGAANKEVYARFGKSRELMTEGELREVLAWVNKRFTLR